MAERTIAIRATGLSKRFGGRVVLNELELEVAAGESVAFTGANGSGKTTLLRCLSSALRPSSGEVRWFGHSAAANPSARRLIGVVGHESLVYPHLTARENLIFAARMCGLRDPVRCVDGWIESAGLRAYADRLPARISRGMRQRLTVVRALVHEPRILLLDEPFSGLDAEGTGWLVGLLSGLCSRGRTVCFATHDREITRRLADRVFRLRSGRIEEVPIGRCAPEVEHVPLPRAA